MILESNKDMERPLGSSSDVRTEVRARYATAARWLLLGGGSTHPPTSDVDAAGQYLEEGPAFGPGHYSARELARVPWTAVCASLGCGNPTADASLTNGQLVLDVGCGGGIDSILAATALAPDGLVIGLDLSVEMVELARRNAATAMIGNALFVVGLMEELPVRDQHADVVLSNSVINLSTEKERTLSELFRALVPGGRLHAIDLVADDSLSPADRMERLPDTNATAGLYSVSEYRGALRSVGFVDVVLTPRHQVADRVRAALVTASRPQR